MAFVCAVSGYELLEEKVIYAYKENVLFYEKPIYEILDIVLLPLKYFWMLDLSS